MCGWCTTEKKHKFNLLTCWMSNCVNLAMGIVRVQHVNWIIYFISHKKYSISDIINIIFNTHGVQLVRVISSEFQKFGKCCWMLTQAKINHRNLSRATKKFVQPYAYTIRQVILFLLVDSHPPRWEFNVFPLWTNRK